MTIGELAAQAGVPTRTLRFCANLTADQRRQIITDLLDEAFAGLDDPSPVAERMPRQRPPCPRTHPPNR